MSNFLGTTVGIIVILVVVPLVIILLILALRGITRSEELAIPPRAGGRRPEPLAASPPERATQASAPSAGASPPAAAPVETMAQVVEPAAETATETTTADAGASATATAAPADAAPVGATSSGEELPIAYCVRCRQKRPVADAEYQTTARGRRRIVGRCTVCDSKVTQFVKSSA